MPPPTEIALPARLEYLVRYCEKNCQAGCCGIDAFDFSALHVASCVSAGTDHLSNEDLEAWEAELKKAEAMIVGLPLNEDGFVCSINGMNWSARPEDFAVFIGEIRHSIRMVPRMLELSHQLRYALR